MSIRFAPSPIGRDRETRRGHLMTDFMILHSEFESACYLGTTEDNMGREARAFLVRQADHNGHFFVRLQMVRTTMTTDLPCNVFLRFAANNTARQANIHAQIEIAKCLDWSRPRRAWDGNDDPEACSAPEGCPGCGCKPGEGVNAKCDHPAGCAFWREVASWEGVSL